MLAVAQEQPYVQQNLRAAASKGVAGEASIVKLLLAGEAVVTRHRASVSDAQR